METNTELLNRIEAHIKGRLAVAESRAASSELYEGKKIAYNSILGVVKGLRADCAAQAQLVPADVQEAADKAAEKAAYKHYPNSPSSGQFGTGDYQPEEDNSLDREVFVKGFKAGIAYERERLMKEAPVADVVEMSGSTDSEYPLVLTLGFPRIPNIEYHGGKVRVIIEEIKEEGK